MNTPSHALINWALLGRGRGRACTPAILCGALLPDLPMFGFWLWQSLGRGLSQQQIWEQVYFEAPWQLLFDAFNALPIYLVLLVVGLSKGSRSTVFFAASALLHIALDLPFHREDAHAHWFPFSSWRFVSPISYWDPAHYGRWFSTLELVGLLAAAVVVARRQPQRWVRGTVAMVALGCTAAWAAALFFT